MRRCPACGAELTRRDGEKRAHFAKRTYCGWDCSVAHRSRAAEERRLAIDAAERRPVDVAAAVEFSRAEILRMARLAAPQVPVALLDDVVRAVEPLIASNVRRKLLAVVAAKYRVTA